MRALKTGSLVVSLCLALLALASPASAGKSCVEKCEDSCQKRAKRSYAICAVSTRARCAVIKRSFAKIKRLKKRSASKTTARKTATKYVSCRVRSISGCIKGQANVYKKCMLACVNTCIK